MIFLGAYFRKFVETGEEQWEDITENLYQNSSNWIVDGRNGVPHLGLGILVKLDCPIAVAPYAYFQKNPDLVAAANDLNGMFDLCVEFDFPGAFYSNLEPKYTYRKKFSTRLRKC